MTNNDTRTLGALVLALLALLWAAGAARANGGPPSDDVLLARTAVREADLDAHTLDDTAAIHAVIAFRAEHIYHSTYAEAVLRATHRAPLDIEHPRPWIVGLWPSARRPRHWPRTAGPWADRRNDWLLTLQHAQDVRRGKVTHRCESTPHDWGSDADARRLLRRVPDAVELNCGDTANRFFAFPRYQRAFE